jgi:uncharacterized membrane protein YraQ (UPF0718 family)
LSIIRAMKKNKLLFLVILAYLILFIVVPEKGLQSGKNSMYYVIEMIQIMPVVFILTSLIEAWVPRETIVKGFGKKSGIKGAVFSFLLGSFSAGPIYAAFPVCKMLLNKGASIPNIVIILSSWAVVKVPMLANEAKFLGPKFMAIRWVLTTISIFIMAYVVPIFVKKESIPLANRERSAKEGVLGIKEQYCIGCGVCSKILPDYFVLIDGKAEVIKKKLTPNMKGEINTIIGKCPSKAIYFN